MHIASVGLLSVGKGTLQHSEDCLGISVHKRNGRTQVVSVCPVLDGVLMVQFRDGAVT